MTEPAAHEHVWTPVGIVTEEQRAYSPVSHFDHQARTNSIAVQSCACGEIKRTLVAYGEWRWINRGNAS